MQLKKEEGKRRRRILEIESVSEKLERGGMRAYHQKGEEAGPSPAAPLLSD